GLVADGHTAVVELAEASGLALVPVGRRDPTRTTTYGTGQLIRIAAERGCDTILVGLGGSATCDGGAGMIQAMGGAFFDSEGNPLGEPLTGGMLGRIGRVEPPEQVPTILIACDVTSPL